jgi:hypothetical protein
MEKSMAINRWTRDQLIVAFALYCQTPFGKMHRSNPEIVKTAKSLGRTASSLAMKLVNFASLDPAITKTGRKGLGNASHEDKKVWEELHANWEGLALRSAEISRALGVHNELPTERTEGYEADGKRAWVEVRIKQDFFRKVVLSSYQARCCMSGLGIPELLIASHIVPWKIDRSNRLNPRNGLCLSVLHDKAFDRGFITVTADLHIKVSKALKQASKGNALATGLTDLDGKKLALPEKFFPDPRFLAYHAENMFKG